MKQKTEIERLYHYTTFDALCSIIKSNEFILSDFIKANDYKEKSILFKREISKYKYMSCTYNVELESYSFTNPPLWYFYADKGHGVCICFDKIKLLSKIKIVKDDFINYCNGVTHIDNQNVIDYLMEKRKDWGYEKEYRILVDSTFNSIPNIFECIASIYIGSEITEQEISLIYKDIPISTKIFQMHTDPTDGRYMSIDYRIKMGLKDKVIQILNK